MIGDTELSSLSGSSQTKEQLAADDAAAAASLTSLVDAIRLSLEWIIDVTSTAIFVAYWNL